MEASPTCAQHVGQFSRIGIHLVHFYELPLQITFWLKGEGTLHPLKIVVTKTKKLHFFSFFSTCGHHI
jgi:hypothetical protein